LGGDKEQGERGRGKGFGEKFWRPKDGPNRTGTVAEKSGAQQQLGEKGLKRNAKKKKQTNFPGH